MAPENFAVRVPKGTGNDLISRLEAIPAAHRDSWRLYRVGAGESLAAIGKRYGASAAAIASANNLPGTDTVEGDRLLIPVAMRADVSARPAARTASRRSPARTSTTASRSKAKAPQAKPAAVTSTKSKPPVMVARSQSR